MILGSLAAYGLSRFSYKFGYMRNADISFFFLSQLILPPVVLALPFLVLYRELALLDTRIGLILLYTLTVLPIVIWIMRDQFESIPTELEEAALVDGLSIWGAFFQIILPIALPGMVAAFILSLVLTWNEYFFAALLTSTHANTLPVMVASQTGSQGINWWAMAALSFAAILPLIVIGVVLERYLIKGMTAGAREVQRSVSLGLSKARRAIRVASLLAKRRRSRPSQSPCTRPDLPPSRAISYRLGTERHHQRRLALPGMVEGIVGHGLGTHQRMDLNPVERVPPRLMLGIIGRHLLVTPPALTALLLKETEDRLPSRRLERQVGRHAGGEILGLVVDDRVDIAEADAQQAVEQSLAERRQHIAADLHRAAALRRRDRVARRAVVEGRQDDNVHLSLRQSRAS